MKKLLQMKFMLLLCALIVGGVSPALADTETITLSEQGYKNGETVSSTQGTVVTLTYTDGGNATAYYDTGTGVRVYAGGKMTVTANDNTITKVVVTYGKDKSPTIGWASNGETTETPTTSSPATWEGSATSVDFTVSTKGHARIQVVEVTYSTSGGSLQTSDLALTGAPVELSFDLYNNSSAQTVSYTTSSTGAVTVSESDYITTVVDETNKTITVTPVAVTPSAQTITVNQAADNNYNAGSATFTVTITDSTPIPTHTASFSVNGTVTTPVYYEEGADIIFPENPADIDDYVFVGWITTSEYPTGDTPELITSATMGTTDITYYAVYAKVSQDGEPEEVLNQTLQYDTWTYNGTTTNKNSYRLFGDGSYVESASFDLSKLSKVKIFGGTFGGQDTYKTVTIGDGTNVWKEVEMTGTGNAKEHSFTEGTALTGNKPLRIISTCGNGSSSGIRMSKIEIYVLQPTISYSDHTTTVVADNREEAGLSFTESTKTVEWYEAENYKGQSLNNPHSVSPITWTSSNEGVATVENGTVKVLALGETTIKASFDGDENYKKGEASYVLTVVDNRQTATVTWKDADGNNITELNVEKGDFIQGITLSCNVEGFTFTEGHLQHLWGTNKTHDNYDGLQPAGYIFTPNAVWTAALGITTITATFPGNETHKPASATLTVTVTGGTETTPYTVAEARAAIDAGTGVTEVYATGIVSEIVTAFNSQYGNITYNISADGLTTSDQLQAYRGKGIGGADFTSADDIQVGDVVVIYGNLTKYGSTYEFGEGNQLVSLVRKPATPTFDPEEGSYTSVQNVTISTTTAGSTIYYTNDVTAPTTESTQYSGAITVDETTTIKAIAVKDSQISDVATAVYVINLSPVITVASPIELDGNTPSKNITISYNNFTPGSDDFGVVYCDENGDELSGGYEWIEKIAQWIDPQIDGTATMRFMFDPNTGSAPRTAYMKIYAMNGNDRVYSELITITQEVYVEPTKVSFYVNGGPIEYSYLEEGDPIVFPEVSNIDGMTFLGWTSNEINGTTDTAPEFVDVTSAKMGTESIDYYAVFALLVAPGTTSTVTDELTKALTGASGSSYSSWEGKKASSDAVYKGNSAGGNDAIQLRSNSNSGIVTTTSGGKLKKVTVEWNENTVDDRTLDIYGKNTAYAEASNLYGANTQGTKIGSIVCGTSTELTISGDYTFIGLRSNSGAMYLDKITIEWETGTPDTYSDYCTTIPAMLTVTIAEACTDGSKYYGTFSSSSAFKVPANVTVSEIGINNGGTMNVQEYAGGAIVPANTGVMVSATTFGEHKLIISSEEGKSVLGAENRLRPTGDNGLTATEMNSAEPETCKFYRLTMHDGTKLGFWWGADGGQSFDIVANKAYLAVPASVAGARNGFAFGDDATGISNVNVNENVNGSVFDLQGRKVNKPGKGLYIVNGKKVVIK